MSSGKDIEFGYLTWSFGQGVTGQQLGEVARTAEEYGMDGVSLPDHVTFPEDLDHNYPASASGEPPWDISDRAYDVFQVGSFIAAQTEDLKLTTNVAVVPYRHPVVLAKNALTLEALSEGRFEFGVAPGWSRAEAEVLDVPFEERGVLMDEFLDLFTRACEEGEIAFDGPHHSFEKTGFYPVPDREIPLLIGGFSSPTFRRVGQFGNGWTTVWDTPEEIDSTKDRIDHAWSDFERSGEPDILLMRPIHVGEHPATDVDDKLLMGDPDSIIEDIQKYIDVGVTRIDMLFYHSDPSTVPEYQIEQIERVSEEVIPSFN